MAKLTFDLEDGQQIVVALAERITLGRADDNDIVVDDERISKRHAELVRNADGSVQVFDADSTAGTFLNGERVRSGTVFHGDKLSFGPLEAVLDLQDAGLNGGGLSDDARQKNSRIATRRKGRAAGRSGNGPDPATVRPQDEMLARLRAETARLEEDRAGMLSELAAAQQAFTSWQQTAEKERQALATRVEALRSAEERLIPMKAAVAQAESAHADWMKAIQQLAAQHDGNTAALQRLESQVERKTGELQQLARDEAAIRQEIGSIAAHRDQERLHLQQVRDECARDEATLADFRRQLAEMEQRLQEKAELAAAREDQVTAAERKLESFARRRSQLEAHIKELAGTEERLVQALEQVREAETRQAALVTAIATLTHDHQRAETAAREAGSRMDAVQKHLQQLSTATEEARGMHQTVDASLQRARDDLATCEAKLAAGTRRLEGITARRKELEQRCQDLATTEQKLAAAQQRLGELETRMAGDDKRALERRAALRELEGDEAATEGRLEVLRAREKDLRGELARLATAERAERARFEEVRQLADEAEKSQATQMQQITTSLDEGRRSLADIISRLTPLREWKDAMDQLYARLAELPQDSPEARALWHEIEKEKAGLSDLINAARSQVRSAGGAEPPPAVAPPAPPAAEMPRPGTGSVILPGKAQETTLRSRLNHLRESVQREETRLEQLRLERTRQESHGRANPAADAMMREHHRILEHKIRQDEERHHALTRTIEMSQAEEEKRRERLADLERKLAELRADIADAERHRSELRQQADLVHTELKNHEATLDRVMKKSAEAGDRT